MLFAAWIYIRCRSSRGTFMVSYWLGLLDVLLCNVCLFQSLDLPRVASYRLSFNGTSTRLECYHNACVLAYFGSNGLYFAALAMERHWALYSSKNVCNPFPPMDVHYYSVGFNSYESYVYRLEDHFRIRVPLHNLQLDWNTSYG